MATVLIGLMVRVERPVRYPFLQDSNGDGSHTQIRLNLSETNVPQAETNRAHQGSKWYRIWTLYGCKGLFERPVRHLQYDGKKHLLVQTCAYNDAGTKLNKV